MTDIIRIESIGDFSRRLVFSAKCFRNNKLNFKTDIIRMESPLLSVILLFLLKIFNLKTGLFLISIVTFCTFILTLWELQEFWQKKLNFNRILLIFIAGFSVPTIYLFINTSDTFLVYSLLLLFVYHYIKKNYFISLFILILFLISKPYAGIITLFFLLIYNRKKEWGHSGLFFYILFIVLSITVSYISLSYNVSVSGYMFFYYIPVVKKAVNLEKLTLFAIYMSMFAVFYYLKFRFFQKIRYEPFFYILFVSLFLILNYYYFEQGIFFEITFIFTCIFIFSICYLNKVVNRRYKIFLIIILIFFAFNVWGNILIFNEAKKVSKRYIDVSRKIGFILNGKTFHNIASNFYFKNGILNLSGQIANPLLFNVSASGYLPDYVKNSGYDYLLYSGRINKFKNSKIKKILDIPSEQTLFFKHDSFLNEISLLQIPASMLTAKEIDFVLRKRNDFLGLAEEFIELGDYKNACDLLTYMMNFIKQREDLRIRYKDKVLLAKFLRCVCRFYNLDFSNAVSMAEKLARSTESEIIKERAYYLACFIAFLTEDFVRAREIMEEIYNEGLLDNANLPYQIRKNLKYIQNLLEQNRRL